VKTRGPKGRTYGSENVQEESCKLDRRNGTIQGGDFLNGQQKGPTKVDLGFNKKNPPSRIKRSQGERGEFPGNLRRKKRGVLERKATPAD